MAPPVADVVVVANPAALAEQAANRFVEAATRALADVGAFRVALSGGTAPQGLYARSDWVDVAWQVLTPVLEAWGAGPAPKFPNYEAGTWGPAETDAFIERDGRRWHRP